MGFFGKILEKLGLKKGEEEAKTAAAPAKPAVSTIRPMTTRPGTESVKPSTAAQKDDVAAHAPSMAAKPAVAAPAAISEVDVVKQLEKLSLGKGLDWKVSIVDLLKLLDIDSSREARNELATELGCPADLMKDSAKMNVWLHKEVLRKIAQNGGNIPQSLLD
jgi:hypothetical protein